MTNSHTPPSVISIVSMLLVKPSGPHQFLMCSGFVQTSQTNSCGASSRADTVRSQSSVLFSSFIFFVTFSKLLAVNRLHDEDNMHPGQAPIFGCIFFLFIGLSG